jgi:hypothetical protein
MATTLIAAGMSAIASAAWPRFCRYVSSRKGKQIIDPLHTLCTVPMRIFDCYKGSLPGVSDHAFGLTKEKPNETLLSKLPFVQSATRAYYGLSHEDFGKTLKAIDQITKYWHPKKDPLVLQIVDWAIEGFKQMPKSYLDPNNPEGPCKYSNVKALCKCFRRDLIRWKEKADTPTPEPAPANPDPPLAQLAISPPTNPPQPIAAAAAAEPALAAPPATPPAASPPTLTYEQAFIAQIKLNWANERLQGYVDSFNQRHVTDLEGFLERMHKLHLSDLKKAAIDKS